MCVPGSEILTVLSPDINAYMHACIQILWRQLIIGLHPHTLLEMAFSFPAAPKKHGIIGALINGTLFLHKSHVHLHFLQSKCYTLTDHCDKVKAKSIFCNMTYLQKKQDIQRGKIYFMHLELIGLWKVGNSYQNWARTKTDNKIRL